MALIFAKAWGITLKNLYFAIIITILLIGFSSS